MTTFGQWGALWSRAGKRSPQIFYRANTRHSWALQALLTKGCSGINTEQVHFLCGHNLTDKILSFSLNLHATEIRSHFCDAWCLLSASSKLFSCHLSQKDQGTHVHHLRPRGLPVSSFPSHANIFSTFSELGVSY